MRWRSRRPSRSLLQVDTKVFARPEGRLTAARNSIRSREPRTFVKVRLQHSAVHYLARTHLHAPQSATLLHTPLRGLAWSGRKHARTKWCTAVHWKPTKRLISMPILRPFMPRSVELVITWQLLSHVKTHAKLVPPLMRPTRAASSPAGIGNAALKYLKMWAAVERSVALHLRYMPMPMLVPMTSIAAQENGVSVMGYMLSSRDRIESECAHPCQVLLSFLRFSASYILRIDKRPRLARTVIVAPWRCFPQCPHGLSMIASI